MGNTFNSKLITTSTIVTGDPPLCGLEEVGRKITIFTGFAQLQAPALSFPICS